MQEEQSKAPDAPTPSLVEVRGRAIPAQTVEVFELTAGELADCIGELMQIAGAIYANKEAVQALIAKAQAQGGKLTPDDIQAGLDIKGVSRAASGALFAMVAKSAGQGIDFVKALAPVSFISLATAALAQNQDFFSTLLALTNLAGPAMAVEAASAQTAQ